MEHGAAVRRAAGTVHGVDLAGAHVEVAGRTDTAIARDLLRGAGIYDGHGTFAQTVASAYASLGTAIEAAGMRAR